MFANTGFGADGSRTALTPVDRRRHDHHWHRAPVPARDEWVSRLPQLTRSIDRSDGTRTDFGFSEVLVDDLVETGIQRFGPVPQRGGSPSSRTRDGMRRTRAA